MKTIPVLAALAAAVLVGPLPAGEEITVEGTISTGFCGMLPMIPVPIIQADDGEDYVLDLDGSGKIDLSDMVVCFQRIAECRRRVSVRGVVATHVCGDSIEGARVPAILEAEVTDLPGGPGCGDVDGGGEVDVSDAILLLVFLFIEDAKAPCQGVTDVNADGTLDISDPILILMHLFGGGPAPICQ